MSTEKPSSLSEERVSFRKEEAPRRFYQRVSPRVIIYPVMVVVICLFMSRNRELSEQARREAESESQAERLATQLDATKAAALVPADAPVFPQLFFYHAGDLQDGELVARLRDRHYRECTIQPVDLRQDARLRERFAGMRTPFAVFSRPDGTTITVADMQPFEFFDRMLTSMLAPQGAPSVAPSALVAP